MRAVPAEGLLSDEELRQRVEAFQAGQQTMERAADGGLLGLIVPPAFGGFGLSYKRLRRVRDSLGATRILRDVMDHWSVCGNIMEKGTYTQYDLFLPQMASGKAYGAWADRFDSGPTPVRVHRIETGFVLNGDLIAMTETIDRCMILVRTSIDGAHRRMVVIPAAKLPQGKVVRERRVLYALHDCIIPESFILGCDGRTPPDTEKWRAIRWNSAPSES